MAVMALDELAEQSADPNTRLFAWLFARHVSAVDMEFTDLMKLAPLASLVAAALEAWVVRDPWLQMDAWQAQDQLSKVVGRSLISPSYQPYFKPYVPVSL